MGEEGGIIDPTWQEKLLFYTTAFFILLGTFSLFAFLFLVPFVIDPAFTTIFMEFDETPATCLTVKTLTRQGASNCSWSSCREGCTKEVYDCTQIRVNYKRGVRSESEDGFMFTTPTIYTMDDEDDIAYAIEDSGRQKRAIREDNYIDNDKLYEDDTISSKETGLEDDYATEIETTGLQPNNSEWYYVGAKLFPNVKGCGYPPILNCSIFLKTYKDIGTNFSCYYSRVDPGLVISELDMDQVYMNLVYAMAIPIPSFIISVIYLTIAYFMIYNEDEDTELLEENAEAMDMDGTQIGITPVPNMATTPIQPASEALTPGSEAFREDLASFGHQFKVAMADELSRESFAVPISNSISIPG